jgi:hypothetical protein
MEVSGSGEQEILPGKAEKSVLRTVFTDIP